jgi:hypothetical protein
MYKAGSTKSLLNLANRSFGVKKNFFNVLQPLAVREVLYRVVLLNATNLAIVRA